jgi:uncharacterized protein with HEPN domain
MTARSAVAHLTDVLEVIGNIRAAMCGVSLEGFEADWQKQWIVERGVEIVSEASRRPPEFLTKRHPDIPWPKIAGIGNVLRHEYLATMGEGVRIIKPNRWTKVRTCGQEPANIFVDRTKEWRKST